MMANEEEQQVPEFKDSYVPAFVALMLHKLGGMQQIPVELLEKFTEKDIPIIDWNPDKKAFMMKTPAYHKRKTRKRNVLTPSRKIITN